MWEMQRRIAAFDAERFQSLGPGYVALNLAGEAGELANAIKKLWRRDPRIGRPDGYAALGAPDRARVGEELADILLMSVVFANHLNIDLETELARKLAVIDKRLQAGYYDREARLRQADDV